MSNRDGNPERSLSVRDYLISKFQFIHLRLTKIYKTLNQKVDIQSLEAAAQIFIEDFPLAVFFVSLDGRFLYGNKKAEELSGYQSCEIVGKTYYQTNLVGLNDLIKIAVLFASHAFDHSLGPYRFSLRRKDGSRVGVELLTRLVNFDSSKAILSVVREVDEPKTERDAAKEELELRQRLSALHKGMSPISICMECKKVQATEEEWVPF